MLQVLLILLFYNIGVDAKGVYYVEEKNGQTYADPAPKEASQQVGNQILEILDLDEPDNSSASRKKSFLASSFMSHLYTEMEEFDNKPSAKEDEASEEWFSADKVSSFAPIEILKEQGRFLLKFAPGDLPDLLDNTLLTSQLRVHVDGFDGKPARLRITSGDEQSATITRDQPSAVFNITAATLKWMAKSEAPNVELEIDTKREGASIDAFIVAAFTENGLRPVKRRSRRAVATTPLSRPPGSSIRTQPLIEHDATSTSCKKQGMYVDFEALGWKEWVIAPQGFMAYYCSGACSFPLHQKMNATSHAIVQTLVHFVRPDAAQEAKCAPAQLQTMKILFIDNKKNVQIKRYRDMVVQECGCH